MTDDLGHYFEVPAERVDPARREAVARKLPALADDLDLADLGLTDGLTVRWFRPTSPTQSAVALPGARPPVGFVAAKGLLGLCRGRDAPGGVWLDADLPLDLGPRGLAWTLAHEAKHAQSLLRPGKGWEYIGEASCEVYAQRFVEGLKRAAPGGGDDVVWLPPAAAAALRRATEGYWAGPAAGTWMGQKHGTWPGAGAIEYSVGVPITRGR